MYDILGQKPSSFFRILSLGELLGSGDFGGHKIYCSAVTIQSSNTEEHEAASMIF